MRFNLPYCTSEFAQIGQTLGVARPGQSERDQGRAAITRIEELLEKTGTPMELASLGVEETHFDQIAASSVKATRLVLNNPAPMTEQAIKALLARGVAGDRSWWEKP
jgi:alcohol dehydrogenase class IV